MGLWAGEMQPRKVVAATAEPTKSRYASIIDENLNKVNADGSVKVSSFDRNERMFNDAGELNASSRKEAFAMGERFASRRDEYLNQKLASRLQSQELSSMIGDAFRDQASMQRFASEVAPLILERLDYQGFIRQVLWTHEVEQGQMISYERDINTTALIVQDDGATIGRDHKSNRVFPMEFWVTAKPEISMEEVLIRQFDIISRLHDKTVQQIQMKEDRAGIRLIYEAANLNPTNNFEIGGPVDKGVLEELLVAIEDERMNGDMFIMHRHDYKDIKLAINAMEFDPVTSREMLLKGILSQIWGKNILVTAGRDKPGQENVSVPQGFIFAVADPRHIGYMPIRLELQVMPADKTVFGELKYGWLFAERIGMLITNPLAVSCAVKTGATVPNWLK